MAFYGNAGNANVTVDPGAGNYGSANKIPIITVDSDQRISAINEQVIIQDSSINANAAIGAIVTYAFMETSDCNSSYNPCLLYTSPSPRDGLLSRMPSSA